MAEIVDLQAIDVSNRQVLEVTTRQGAKVIFGFDGMEAQLERWRAVHEYAASSSRALASLDLSVSNNVPARWLEAGLSPQVLPKKSKGFLYKKKHV